MDSLRKRVEREPDFVHCPRHGDSLTKLVESSPEPAEGTEIPRAVARVLRLTPAAAKRMKARVIAKLRGVVPA